MRFFEFSGPEYGDRIVMILRNYIGRAASKKVPSTLNWAGFNNVLKSAGFPQGADYETFKSIYDSSPVIQKLVRDFNEQGLELNIPGTPESDVTGGSRNPADSEEEIDKIASSAAPKQLSQQAKTPTPPPTQA